MRITAIEKRREQLTPELHKKLNCIYNMIRSTEDKNFIVVEALEFAITKALRDDGYDIRAHKFTNDEEITELRIEW